MDFNPPESFLHLAILNGFFSLLIVDKKLKYLLEKT